MSKWNHERNSPYWTYASGSVTIQIEKRWDGFQVYIVDPDEDLQVYLARNGEIRRWKSLAAAKRKGLRYGLNPTFRKAWGKRSQSDAAQT